MNIDEIPKHRNATIAEVTDYFTDKQDVIGIFLSGSLAAGTDDNYSDIDMRVVVSDTAHPQYVANRLLTPQQWSGFLFNVGSAEHCVTHFEQFFKLDLFYISEKYFTPDPWYRLPIKILFDPHKKLESVFDASRTLSIESKTDNNSIDRGISKCLAYAHETLRRINRDELLYAQYLLTGMRGLMIEAELLNTQSTSVSSLKIDQKLPTETRQIILESYVESNRISMKAALTNLLLHFNNQVVQLHEMYDLDRELKHDLKAIRLVKQLIKQTAD